MWCLGMSTRCARGGRTGATHIVSLGAWDRASATGRLYVARRGVGGARQQTTTRHEAPTIVVNWVRVCLIRFVSITIVNASDTSVGHFPETCRRKCPLRAISIYSSLCLLLCLPFLLLLAKGAMKFFDVTPTSNISKTHKRDETRKGAPLPAVWTDTYVHTTIR